MANAVVLTEYGFPDVLVWRDVAPPEPDPGQVRIRVKAPWVSPTYPKVRRGDLKEVVPLPTDAVLGFGAAAVAAGLGSGAIGRRTAALDALEIAGDTEASFPKTALPSPTSRKLAPDRND